ncbi:hypothetical protein ABK040_007802 [Willaertia magna]
MFSSAPPLEEEDNYWNPNLMIDNEGLKYNMIHVDALHSKSYVGKNSTFSIFGNNIEDNNEDKGMIGTINASGKDGNDGLKGRSGINGRSGRHAQYNVQTKKQGERGEPGENGTDGFDASYATNGENADNLFVLIDKSSYVKDLILRYKKEHGRKDLRPYVDEHYYTSVNRFYLYSNDDYVLLKANGGNGGKGGDGGNGGNGGLGGNGSNGLEVGGDGGDGGHGGNGGRPSEGAPGGNGGDIVICGHDPRLFMLLKTQMRGGENGVDGAAGKPGEGGKGGKGGTGSIKSGRDGRNGNNGKIPSYNVSSKSKYAYDGRALYRVLDHTNRVIYEGEKLYSAKLLSYDIIAKEDDGIFEPGEFIYLTNFKIYNEGDIPLPAGSILKILNDPHGNIIGSDQIILPEIAPKQTIMISNNRLTAKINPEILDHLDLSSHRKQSVLVSVGIELVDRIFPDSILGGEIPVEYPVHISAVDYLKQMGRGDACELFITFTNNSKYHYPCYYKLNVMDQLFLVETEQKEIGSVLNLENDNNIIQTHPILMGFDSGFYENQKFTIEFYFKDVLIQKIVKSVQCVPHYNSNAVETTDVLWITNKSVGRDEFQTFSNLFQSLNLRVNIWDKDFYKGISYCKDTADRHKTSWVDLYKNKLIIYSANRFSDINELYASDLVSHFGFDDETKYNSGFILICNEQPNIEYLKKYLLESGSTFVTKLSKNEFSGYYKVYNPTESDAINKCKELENEYETKSNNLERYSIIIDQLNIKSIKSDSWISWKYSYGTASLHKIPINTLQKFVGLKYVHKVDLSTQMDIEEKQHDSISKILLKEHESQEFQLVYTIISSLSLDLKLYYLKTLDEMTSKGSLLISLIKWVLFEDIKREIKLNSDKFITLERMIEKLMTNNELCCKEIVYTVAFLIYKTLNHLYWRSWIPESLTKVTTSFKNKRKKINQFVTTFETKIKERFTSIEDNQGTNLEDILSQAKSDANLNILQYPKQREVFQYLLEKQ